MESPRLSNRLASKRKVMEEEGKDVPWKTLMKVSKSKNTSVKTPGRHNSQSKNGATSKGKRSNLTSGQVKSKSSVSAKKSSTVKATENKNLNNTNKERRRPRKVLTLKEKVNERSIKSSKAALSRNGNEHTKEELAGGDKQVSKVKNNVIAASQVLVDDDRIELTESSDMHTDSALTYTSVAEPVAEEIETSRSDEYAESKDLPSVNTASVELLPESQSQNTAVSDQGPVVDTASDIQENSVGHSCTSTNTSTNIPENSSGASSPQLLQKQDAEFVNVTVESSEMVTLNEVPNDDNTMECACDAPSGSGANSQDQDDNEVTVQEFRIEGQTATPVRNALLDIIMKRQQLKEDNHESLVAATIPNEDVPPGTSEQVQDVLGQMAMECNVEFMLSDKMVLAYGSWQEVEKARRALTQLRKQREEDIVEATQQEEPSVSSTTTADREQDSALEDHTENGTNSSDQPSVASSSEPEPIQVHIEEDIQGLSSDNLEGSAIILEVVEPTDEEGQKELEESGVRTFLDQHNKLGYSRQSMFVRDKKRATYTCEDCGFRSTKQGVAKHRMRFHNDLQHSCIVCGLTFGMRYDMRVHRLSHFDIEGNLLPKGRLAWVAVNPNMEPVHLWELEKGFQIKDKALEKIKECAAEKDKSTAGDLSWMKNQIRDDESSDGASETGEKTDKTEELVEEALETFVEFVEDEGDDAVNGETKVVYVVQKRREINAICNLCGYIGLVAAVRKHCERQHPVMTYQCPICKKKCGVVNDMQRHLQGHSEYSGSTDSKTIRKLAICEECDFAGETKIVRNHIKTHHGTSLQYTETSEPGPRRLKYDSLNPLQAQGNIALPKDSERFSCEICEKEILLSRYKHHMKSHEPGWKCDLCDFSHRSKSVLVQHKQKEHDEGYHICNVCNKRFSSESSLKFHMFGVHNREAARAICKVCNKIFATERFLKVHMQRIHEKIKRYFCDICNKGFYEKIRMLEHRVVHGSEDDKESIKKWKCSFCDRRFRTRYCAQQHENCHTGAKPFKCSYCSRTFAWKTEAQKHEICVHTEGTAFNCNVCGRGFKFQYKLNNHMMLHNKIIKNMCQLCGKCFTMPSTLRKHNCKPLIAPLIIAPNSVPQERLKEETNEAVEYLCGLCNESFESVEDIVAHMSDQHEAHSALLGATNSTLEGIETVTMENAENNVEMMYIPKDEEMIVLAQNSEHDLQSEVVHETVAVCQYDAQENVENVESQILQIEESQGHSDLKEQLSAENKVYANPDHNEETFEIIIDNAKISSNSKISQLVIVDDQSVALQNETVL